MDQRQATTAPVMPNPQGQPQSWVKWEPGQTRRLTILENQASQRLVHWIAGKGCNCAGPNCGFCAAGDRPKVRWSITVSDGGSPTTWEMANLTYTDLTVIGSQSGGLKGLIVNVTRAGEGRATRYIIVPAGKAEVAPTPNEHQRAVDEIKAIAEEIGLPVPSMIKLFHDTTDHIFESAKPEEQLAQLLRFARGLKTERDAEAAAKEGNVPSLEGFFN